jgi:hypothetical protein
MDQNPPFPSPEELRSKLSEFMKSNFGDKVSFATFAQPDAEQSAPRRSRRNLRKTSSRSISAARHQGASRPFRHPAGRGEEGALDRGLRSLQPRQLCAPARARGREARGRDRIREAERDSRRADGRGKTYLIKHIAELLKVPFVKADATKFSETGYVGGDVEDLVRELVQKADGEVARRSSASSTSTRSIRLRRPGT